MAGATVNLYEAKASLSKLIERAAAGEDHHRQGRQAQGAPGSSGRSRPAQACWEGKVWVADDFDEPLPPEVLLALVY